LQKPATEIDYSLELADRVTGRIDDCAIEEILGELSSNETAK
jgi:hypothetical protein